MIVPLRLPKTLQWVMNLLIIFLLLFTLYRFVTFVAFKPAGEKLSDNLSSFALGLRFDLRWISIVLLPIVMASLVPEFSPFYSARNKKIWTWYLALVTFFFFFFFAADFGCFSYNKTRLNASALNFAEDPGISAQMLWQSYPIVWMVMALILAVLLIRRMFQRLHRQVVLKTDGKKIRYNRNWFLGTVVLFGLLAYGGFSSQPLRWKAAFRFNDSFKSYLALNPLQNFFTTLKFRKPQFDATKARAYAPLMASWMQVGQTNGSFTRVVTPRAGSLKGKPNVVLVLCESFSMYKSSLSGNPMNTTPFLKTMSDQGVFFNRCFTPHFSTARGLFATLTGIPDVQLSKFSTRNPEALQQHTIINDFSGYQKLYFLGGSASFNNFEGLVRNIKEVRMITEGQFRTRPLNVWGISDKDLFQEANSVFRDQKQPFFAIIHTADNHRPFTIPQGDSDFHQLTPGPDELKKNGFESVEEFNAFRYFDHTVQHFMADARKESYFNNTVFVFVGDHGVSGNASAVYPKVWTEERLTDEHVPLLFYAPGLLAPEQRNAVVSQIDVLPTIAGLTGQTYTNTTLGRDVLDPATRNHYAFVILHDEGRIGLITDDFYFTKNLNFSNEEVHPLGHEVYSEARKDSIRRKMSDITSAYYETARWMLVNNKEKYR
ncbi:MAG TPA: sulfatase-like hydrolase/transferase [Flavisolibacter sp.]|jgi:phosphoglycerol transferase MdoB-like AlkP superfamily enzyme|nr:sulfatase-like hydrolase/transferase [Flavisolibacter sp.]